MKRWTNKMMVLSHTQQRNRNACAAHADAWHARRRARNNNHQSTSPMYVSSILPRYFSLFLLHPLSRLPSSPLSSLISFQTQMLQDLPEFVIFKIILLLDSPSVLFISITCKRFGDQNMWRRILQVSTTLLVSFDIICSSFTTSIHISFCYF